MRKAGMVRAAAHEAPGDGMASTGGDVAGDDRDDFGESIIRICSLQLRVFRLGLP
jgi:hypothetical protein